MWCILIRSRLSTRLNNMSLYSTEQPPHNDEKPQSIESYFLTYVTTKSFQRLFSKRSQKCFIEALIPQVWVFLYPSWPHNLSDRSAFAKASGATLKSPSPLPEGCSELDDARGRSCSNTYSFTFISVRHLPSGLFVLASLSHFLQHSSAPIS